MNEQEFKDRTKPLGLRVIQMLEEIPRSSLVEVLGRQLLRSATSVGANYRAACRGRSNADVIAKLGVVEEETDETLYWLEMFREARLAPQVKLDPLMSDANEILAMVVASIKTLRSRNTHARPEILVVQSKIQNPKSKIC